MTSMRFVHLKTAKKKRGKKSNIKGNLFILIQKWKIPQIFKENVSSIFSFLFRFSKG